MQEDLQFIHRCLVPEVEGMDKASEAMKRGKMMMMDEYGRTIQLWLVATVQALLHGCSTPFRVWL
jgi:hypothetical protein